MRRVSLVLITLLAVVISSRPAPVRAATPRCPPLKALPQLGIQEIERPDVPVRDGWQVFFDGVPLSDAQLAALSRDEVLAASLRAEMRARGTWVYASMLAGAGGAAISSIGWVLYGQDNVPQGVSLPMALGGLVVGLVGVLWLTHSVQAPLEPFTAPTPAHRVSLAEARDLVAVVNRRLRQSICDALSAEVADEDEAGPVRGVREVLPSPEHGAP